MVVQRTTTKKLKYSDEGEWNLSVPEELAGFLPDQP